MASTAPTSRVREKPAGEEEASVELNLGEFNDVQTLTLSEARLLVNAVTSHRNARNLDDNDVFKKTMEYLDLFARYKDKNNIEAIEQILNQRQELHLFERAQLANLAISTEQDDDSTEGAAQQAKQLIPSLADKISDEDLLQLLEDLEKLRTTSGE